jgi:hypothetical protein
MEGWQSKPVGHERERLERETKRIGRESKRERVANMHGWGLVKL